MKRSLVVLALVAVASGVVAVDARGERPPAREPSVRAFLGRDEIVPPARSIAYVPPEVRSSGCGAGVDGRADDWHAEPTWINGTGRVADREYVWTDYPADDAGTGGLRYPGDGEELAGERGAVEASITHNPTVGRPTPRLNRYGGSAADVVEVRAAVRGRDLHLLTTFSFLNALDSTVLGFGFDVDGAESGFADWPLGARLRTPGLDAFVTLHASDDGFCGTLTTAAGSTDLAVAGGAAAIDTDANVVEAAIPLDALGAIDAVRVVGGSGVWDPAAGTWMAPETLGTNRNQTDRVTGAQTATDPAVFNLLFRHDEPLVDLNDVLDSGSSNSVKRSFQTQRQQETLAGGTSGPYGVDLDLRRLRTGGADDPVPVRRGDDVAFTRTYRSRVSMEGLQFASGNQVVYLGRYQPYAVHLPACYESGCPGRWPGDRAPLVVDFHGGDGSHVNQLSEAAGVEQAEKLDERAGAIVVAPLGRGRRQPWYRGLGEADVVEVVDAMETHYRVDGDRKVVTGASLGGYATYRAAAVHPDLWAGAAAHCPAAYENSTSDREIGNEAPQTQTFTIEPLVQNLLNVPLVQVSGTGDPLVRIDSGHRLRDRALAAQLDLRYTEYLASSHCFLVPGVTGGWMANHVDELVAMIRDGRDSAPARVRFGVDPRHRPMGPEEIGVFDTRDIRLLNDTAYWVSGLVPRAEVSNDDLGVFVGGNAPAGPGDEVVGTIDAASHARPGWQVTAEPCGSGTGLAGLAGGNPDAEPDQSGNTPLTYNNPHLYECQRQVRSGHALEPVLDLAVRALAAATIDLAGAGLTAGEVTVLARGDGPIDLTFAGAGTATGACVDAVHLAPGGITVTASLTGAPCTIGLAR